MTLFLDANIIIYLVEGGQAIRDRVSRTIGRYREQEDTRVAVSRLSWLECRIHPLRMRDQAMLKAYASFFTAPDLLIVELTAPVVEAAAQLRAALNVSTPDALQAASALQITGPVTLFSNDRRLAKVPGLMVKPV